MTAELVIDSFAGGGGASLGIEQAIGRPVDIAINHDAEAVAMHIANHPETTHFTQDIYRVNPRKATRGQPVALLWASPDCTHHSKARGGKPVEKKIRDLAWVVVDWAREVRPRVIMLENVEEFRGWGPLVTQTDADGVDRFVPDPERRGETFDEWTDALRSLGYQVEWRELRACDYGAPTIRKRLFVIARCDGAPIVWPEPTHAKGGAGGLLPYRTAAECIDWSIPCPSIFERKRPLAEATLRRIANGIRRYVIEAEEPFIVRTGHYSHRSGEGFGFRGQGLGEPLATVTSVNDYNLVSPYLASITHNKAGDGLVSPGDAPVPTITASKGGEHALVAPALVRTGSERSQSRERSTNEPFRTVMPSPNEALTAAFLAKHYGGHGTPGAPLDEPVPTVTAVDHNAAIASHLVKLYGTANGAAVTEPVATVTGQGQHLGEVRAFLAAYYGNDRDGQSVLEPFRTLTSKERFGLVYVQGEPYQIVDIGMRMLAPRELYRAQGFPDGYVIAPSVNGKRLTKTAQVRMCGNSVVPQCARVLVKANVGQLGQGRFWHGYEVAAAGGGS